MDNPRNKRRLIGDARDFLVLVWQMGALVVVDGGLGPLRMAFWGRLRIGQDVRDQGGCPPPPGGSEVVLADMVFTTTAVLWATGDGVSADAHSHIRCPRRGCCRRALLSVLNRSAVWSGGVAAMRCGDLGLRPLQWHKPPPVLVQIYYRRGVGSGGPLHRRLIKCLWDGGTTGPVRGVRCRHDCGWGVLGWCFVMRSGANGTGAPGNVGQDEELKPMAHSE